MILYGSQAAYWNNNLPTWVGRVSTKDIDLIVPDTSSLTEGLQWVMNDKLDVRKWPLQDYTKLASKCTIVKQLSVGQVLVAPNEVLWASLHLTRGLAPYHEHKNNMDYQFYTNLGLQLTAEHEELAEIFLRNSQ